MKKTIFSPIMLPIIIAIFFFAPINIHSTKDKLLMENIEVLANDIVVSDTDKNPISLADCWMSVTPQSGSAQAFRKCDPETTTTTIYSCSTEWIEGIAASNGKQCYRQ